MTAALLDLQDVRKTFNRTVRACRGVSFEIRPGEIVGVVGESGSGKSTVADIVLGLTRADSGTVTFDGRSVTDWLSSPDARRYRSKVQAVFQDPVRALDSRRTVGWSVAEPLLIHQVGTAASRRARVAELLTDVGLDPALMYDRYPSQISGGQAQRVCIARALALEPSLLVCDEAVSALDVSVQAQILNLLLGIQRRSGMAVLFISHALPVVRHLADTLVVMYAGTVVERGLTERVCADPAHPYTRLLIDSAPEPDPTRAVRKPRLTRREGLPDAGCRFAPRCALVTERCRVEEPEASPVGDERLAACWRAGELAPS